MRLKVDVIVAPSDPSIAAAQKATTSIPIVMVTSTDPVGSGFVASLARPGGNITGLTVQSSDVVAKRLQLLKEAVPDLSQIAVVWDPRILSGRRQVSETRAAAQTLGVQIQPVEVPSPAKFDGAFASMTRDRAGAAFIVGSQMPYVYRTRIAELAVKHRLPTTCPLREYVEAGCLIGYGTSVAYQWRRAASYVDKILKGASPETSQSNNRRSSSSSLT